MRNIIIKALEPINDKKLSVILFLRESLGWSLSVAKNAAENLIEGDDIVVEENSIIGPNARPTVAKSNHPHITPRNNYHASAEDFMKHFYKLLYSKHSSLPLAVFLESDTMDIENKKLKDKLEKLESNYNTKVEELNKLKDLQNKTQHSLNAAEEQNRIDQEIILEYTKEKSRLEELVKNTVVNEASVEFSPCVLHQEVLMHIIQASMLLAKRIGEEKLQKLLEVAIQEIER